MKKLMTLFALGLAAPVTLVWAAAPGDWTSYGRDQGGTRFSPLTQITPTNVGQLKMAWTIHMNPLHGTGAAGANNNPSTEATPLAINGVLYLGTPYGRVVAIDGETGKEIWVYTLPAGEVPARRGIAYWPGDGKTAPEIVVGTSAGTLIALSPATGMPVERFGTHGIVDAKTPEIMKGYPKDAYRFQSPPSMYKNLIITGATTGSHDAGDVRAWDARTGNLVWTFHSVPRPGEVGHDTWEGDSWVNRSGVNVWNMMTVDTRRGIVYMPFAAPNFNRYGGDRHGANLFSDSLVAADAATGKYLWHFQILHHDIWDNDLDTPPTLVDVKKDGKVIPAVIAMNKDALLYILDRVTGKPIFGVTEQPVLPSTVPGEQAWPTQPIPNKPVQLARASFALNEVASVTPELHDYCQAMIEHDHLQPTVRFQPIAADANNIRFPSGEGGPEWAGGAFEPRLGYYIVNTNDIGYIERLVHLPEGRWSFTTRWFADPKHNLCQQPPWGNLTAVNVSTGDIAWRINLGITDSLPPGKQETGRPNNGGPILTASGLIFIGGTDDARFRAFDSKTGKLLWTYKLDYSATDTPITYLGKNGKQYVAVVATGGTVIYAPPGGDSLVVFALPGRNDERQPRSLKPQATRASP